MLLATTLLWWAPLLQSRLGRRSHKALDKAPLSDLHAKQIDGDSALLAADLCGPQHYATRHYVTSIVHHIKRSMPLNLPPAQRPSPTLYAVVCNLMAVYTL